MPWRAPTNVQHHGALWASRPQLKRDPLDGALSPLPSERSLYRLLCYLAITWTLACGHSVAGPCGAFLAPTTWQFSMSSPDGNRLDAEIRTVDGIRRLVGTATTPEGTREPLHYPVDSLTVRNDSIRFRFAPASFLVEGKCSDTTRIDARYEVDLRPSFQLIHGVGEFHRGQLP